MDKVKIVIVLEGGLVSNVFCTQEADVLVCDYDTDGADDNDLMEAPAGDQGYHHMGDANVEPGLISAWFHRFEKWEPKGGL